MTDRRLYWRAPLSRAHCVAYKELNDLHFEREWLTINGYFFTANPSLNLKLYKLLKKLRRHKKQMAEPIQASCDLNQASP